MLNIKNLPEETGIYQILNVINGHCYIGQAQNIYNRFNKHHIYDYKNKNSKCYNTQLYQALRKYGLENFKVNIIELCPKEKLNEREKYWIKYYNSFHQGYNMTEGGQSLSSNLFSKETEEKRKTTREKNQSLVGENHPRSKITNEEVKDIRDRYIKGESIAKIWKDYIELYPSLDVFRQIVVGKSYSNVDAIKTEDIRYTNAKFTKEQVLEIRTKYYTQNMSYTKLSKEYNVSVDTIKSLCQRITYKHIIDDIPDLRKRKSYRLKEHEVREIRRRYKEEKLTYKQLADEYKIDPTAIQRCCDYITYSHII